MPSREHEVFDFDRASLLFWKEADALAHRQRPRVTGWTASMVLHVAAMTLLALYSLPAPTREAPTDLVHAALVARWGAHADRKEQVLDWDKRWEDLEIRIVCHPVDKLLEEKLTAELEGLPELSRNGSLSAVEETMPVLSIPPSPTGLIDSPASVPSVTPSVPRSATPSAGP